MGTSNATSPRSHTTAYFTRKRSQATRLMDVIVDRVMDDEQPGGPQQELQYTDKIFFFEVIGRIYVL